MATKKTSQPYIHYHADGSVWAKGKLKNGKFTGYWEWFRKDGTRLRSGSFEDGTQTGEWTTYDKSGKVYKVTVMKPKAAKKKAPTLKSKKTLKPNKPIKSIKSKTRSGLVAR